MKIIAEFNSTEELINFVNTFGVKAIQNSEPKQGIGGQAPMEKVKKEEVKLSEPQKEELKKAVTESDRYYYHPESDSYWVLPKGEEIPKGIDFENSSEISIEEYEKGISKQQKVKSLDEADNNEKTIVTKEIVREKIAAAMKAGKQKEVKDIVAKYGASKVPDLKEENYAAVIKEVEALL